MSKQLAAYFGQNSLQKPQEPTPQEYTVLGINQPLIAPETLPEVQPTAPPSARPTSQNGQRRFRLSLLLNKLL